jgi:hypothetical protein
MFRNTHCILPHFPCTFSAPPGKLHGRTPVNPRLLSSVYFLIHYSPVILQFFFTSSCSHFWSIGLISQFLDQSQTVGLLGRVINSSQCLYLNTGQRKHRKTHTDIKHPCPEQDSNPRSQPPSERRQYMP